ncbi:D-2-hydroxyacid dehydrogenase [Haloglomus litoreum]|uniref:D-2-hydroxyacid dehydrogenase n=1 Tax=Haloglomus litoreum TaxID=3034026 RepID=UPI0023E81757|nr:D-2-hydroxyacid dehydrogenase [Haloglomus sp. DT116]
MPERPSIVVLRAKPHGIPAEEYHQLLRDRLPDHSVELARTPHEERELITDADIATGIRFDPVLLDHAEALRLFACGAAGVDHLPLERLAEAGVALTNASGVHGPNIAEHVLGSLLVFARGLHRAWARQERAEWRHERSFGELQGSTVTVVGLGAIGEAIVDRLSPFGVPTIGVRHTPEKGGPTDEVVGYGNDPFHDALARTDYLVLACPLSETTRGLVGAEELRTLPPSAVLVNVARGPVVDTEALLGALRNFSQLRGAALDVTDPEPLPNDHPLWDLGNVLLTPHCAGDTPQYWERLADIVVENVERVESTGTYDGLRNQVLPRE